MSTNKYQFTQDGISSEPSKITVLTAALQADPNIGLLLTADDATAANWIAAKLEEPQGLVELLMMIRGSLIAIGAKSEII